MAKRGKNINLFLIDGEPNGRIKCSLSNWTGVVYKIPRTLFDKCKDIEYLQQSGVYFLFGEDNEGNSVVYIGQAGVRKNGKGLLYRINEPHNTIDYWTEAIMLTTRDNSFGPTEISYLENRFCNLAIEAKRYIVKNGNDPNPGNITEEKESELEEFIDYAKIVMGTLGHKVFEPYISETDDDEDLFYISRNGANATCKPTVDGFVLLKESIISSKTTKSCPEFVLKARMKYALKIKNNVLLEDILFTSPSGAAAFVLGASANGNIEWKTENGIVLKEYQK